MPWDEEGNWYPREGAELQEEERVAPSDLDYSILMRNIDPDAQVGRQEEQAYQPQVDQGYMDYLQGRAPTTYPQETPDQGPPQFGEAPRAQPEFLSNFQDQSYPQFQEMPRDQAIVPGRYYDEQGPYTYEPAFSPGMSRIAPMTQQPPQQAGLGGIPFDPVLMELHQRIGQATLSPREQAESARLRNGITQIQNDIRSGQVTPEIGQAALRQAQQAGQDLWARAEHLPLLMAAQQFRMREQAMEQETYLSRRRMDFMNNGPQMVERPLPGGGAVRGFMTPEGHFQQVQDQQSEINARTTQAREDRQENIRLAREERRSARNSEIAQNISREMAQERQRFADPGFTGQVPAWAADPQAEFDEAARRARQRVALADALDNPNAPQGGRGGGGATIPLSRTPTGDANAPPPPPTVPAVRPELANQQSPWPRERVVATAQRLSSLTRSTGEMASDREPGPGGEARDIMREMQGLLSRVAVRGNSLTNDEAIRYAGLQRRLDTLNPGWAVASSLGVIENGQVRDHPWHSAFNAPPERVNTLWSRAQDIWRDEGNRLTSPVNTEILRQMMEVLAGSPDGQLTQRQASNYLELWHSLNQRNQEWAARLRLHD